MKPGSPTRVVPQKRVLTRILDIPRILMICKNKIWGLGRLATELAV